MKRFSIVLIMLALCIAAHAQDASVQSKIAEIRKYYNSRMEWISTMLEDETIPDDYISARIRHNVAGTGQADGTVEFFFSDDFNEEVDSYESYLYMVRRTMVYTIPERKTYEELLYDEEGLPAFYYSTFWMFDDNGGKLEEMYYEIRVYYDKGVQIHDICRKGKDKSSLKDVKADDYIIEYMVWGFSQFESLKSSFNNLMNN